MPVPHASRVRAVDRASLAQIQIGHHLARAVPPPPALGRGRETQQHDYQLRRKLPEAPSGAGWRPFTRSAGDAGVRVEKDATITDRRPYVIGIAACETSPPRGGQ